MRCAKEPDECNVLQPSAIGRHMCVMTSSVTAQPSLHKDDEDKGGLLDAALNVAMNSHLEAFGIKVTETATAFVAQHGLKVVTDPMRAKKLSLINLNSSLWGRQAGDHPSGTCLA